MKTNPIYESNDLVHVKTHYYEGIKKYQWLAYPLSRHSLIIKKFYIRFIVTLGQRIYSKKDIESFFG
jgi:aspartyl aminopeptidase